VAAMKHYLLIIALVALVGCGKRDEPEPQVKAPANPKTQPKVSAKSPVAKKPDNISPPKHTTDPFELIQNRIKKKEAILVDVREKFEWEDGHLQSAVFLPLSELEEGESDEAYATNLTQKIPKDKIVYCHCASGGRVMPASAILQKLGYDARPLKSGYRDLLKAGFEKAE
jgi:phage shock protein E